MTCGLPVEPAADITGGATGQPAVASGRWEDMSRMAPARLEAVDPVKAARFDLYPWNPEHLGRSEAGKLLLKAVDAARPDRAEPVDGLHWRFFVDRAEHGVKLFEAFGLPRAAGEAGIWYEHVDQGSVELGSLRQVYMPDGPAMSFVVNFHSGELLLPDSMWADLHYAGRLGERVDAYFTLGCLYLPEIASLDLYKRSRLFVLAFPSA